MTAVLEDTAAPRAFLYARNSSDPYRKGTSTRDQMIENRRTCALNGWVIAGEFEDTDRSASRYATRPREDYEAMVERLRAGECDILVTWETSRAYRDLEAYLPLRKLCEAKGVLWCQNGTLYDMRKSSDRTNTAVLAVLAESEADRIRDRNLRTARLNAERGQPHGAIPFGYRREYDPRSGALVAQVPFEPEAEIVREVASRIAQGDPCYRIAKDLNARGVQAPGGPGIAWLATGVRALVRPVHIGKRSHRGRIVCDGTWDAVLEPEAYFAMRRVLDDPARRTQRDTTIKYLLSGVAFCFCGGQLRRRKSGQRSVYICVTCFKAAIGVEVLDGIVERALLKYVEKPAFTRRLVASDGSASMQAALAEAEAMQEQLEASRTLAATFQGGRFLLSPASLAALESQLLPLIESARERARDATVPPVLRRIAGPGAREVWAAMGLPERRTVIREVVRVTLNKAATRGQRVVTPERYALDWLR